MLRQYLSASVTRRAIHRPESIRYPGQGNTDNPFDRKFFSPEKDDSKNASLKASDCGAFSRKGSKRGEITIRSDEARKK